MRGCSTPERSERRRPEGSRRCQLRSGFRGAWALWTSGGACRTAQKACRTAQKLVGRGRRFPVRGGMPQIPGDQGLRRRNGASRREGRVSGPRSPPKKAGESRAESVRQALGSSDKPSARSREGIQSVVPSRVRVDHRVIFMGSSSRAARGPSRLTARTRSACPNQRCLRCNGRCRHGRRTRTLRHPPRDPRSHTAGVGTRTFRFRSWYRRRGRKNNNTCPLDTLSSRHLHRFLRDSRSLRTRPRQRSRASCQAA
jgi:hypothetical protein